MPSGRLAAAVLLIVVLSLAGCAISGGTLGGREKCWGDQARAASLWRGILQIDASGSRLATPEGEIIPLLPGALITQLRADGTGEIVFGERVVARAGDDVTLFGGAGSDGALVVCAVEEVH